MPAQDTAQAVAFNDAAPPAERQDALTELQKSAIPTALLAPEVMEQLFEMQQYSHLNKAQIIEFPGLDQHRKGNRGKSSVDLDDFQLNIQGEYYERPSAMTFDSMRGVVDQTPVLSAVVLTRVRQIQRFCRVNDSGEGVGFKIGHIDKDHQVTKSETESMALLSRFFSNCGWEFNPRARKRLKRDSFPQFMAKVSRDTLTMDSVGIETEFKKDRAKGIDGLYAIDGATIRLCTELGYQGDPDMYALQVVQGRIRTAYSYDDLIYEPRNPRSDVLVGGYGLSEVELMVRVVTGFLNAMTYNIRGFDSNAIPKGILHLSGGYAPADLAAFKRYWNAMVKGVNNAWTLPVMVSKDQESKASFEKFGVEFNEMYFAKWMTFLTSIICAIYGMSPAEINFDSFSGGSSSPLAGSDTEQKLAASKDSGLRPILSYFENLFTDYVSCEFSDKYVFRWTGLDDDDADKKEERSRLILTVDELRAQDGHKKIGNGLGDAPLNPSLVGPWLQMQQAQQPQDFGQPGSDQPGQAKPGQEQPKGAADGKGEVGAEPKTDEDPGQPKDFGKQPDEEQDFGKALGVVYTLDI